MTSISAAPADIARVGNVVLRRISVRDFRNLAHVDLDLRADGLAVVGENGHGKTNLLEAIYYLQLLRSTRGARDPEVVRFGAAGFHVAGDLTIDDRDRRIAVGFERAGKRKRVTLDGSVPQRMSEALGAVPSVIFSPRDVQLVAGGPSERRRFLDVALALTSRRYLIALQNYRAALARRNAALRDAARGGHSAARAAVWEPALAEHGAILYAERVAWVDQMAGEYARLCMAIGERGEVRIRYVSTVVAARDEARSATEAREALERSLEAHRAQDLRRGLTHIGPHRDDLDLTLAGRALRVFGSAGQQRTAAIALRLLEAATLLERRGSTPLVLLDDPFAELDSRRAHRILRLLGEAGLGQSILAVPRAEDIPGALTDLERREIVDGVVR